MRSQPVTVWSWTRCARERARVRGFIEQRATLAAVTVMVVGWGAWIAAGKLREAASSPVFGLPTAPKRSAVSAPATFTPWPAPRGVRVTGAAGVPLPTAELWQAPAGARVLDPARCERAPAAADGTFVLTAPLPAGMQWLVRAPAHRTVALPELAADAGVQVALAPAAVCRVRCALADGSPVAGARVMIARSSMPKLDATAWGHAGGADPRAAVYTAVSAQDGVAVFDGLAAGDYEIALEHDLHVRAAEAPGVVQVPATDLLLPFVEVAACVLAVPADDELVAGAIGVAPGTLRSTMPVLTAVRRLEEGLRRRYPGKFVHALPATDDGSPRPVHGMVLLRKRGWHTFVTELRGMRDLVPAPLPLPAPGDGDGLPQMAKLRVHSPPHATAAAPQGDMGLALNHVRGHVTCHVPLPVDATIEVPEGAYAIVADNSAVARRLPKQMVWLRAGELTEYRLDLAGLHAARLRVLAPDGDALGTCAVTVEEEGQAPRGQIALDGDNVPLVLPTGSVALLVEGMGFAKKRVALRIPDDVVAGVITLRLDYVD